MKATLIFADVHLKVTPAERSTREAFIEFLHSFRETPLERVIILGDLFDFWFEYRHVIFSGYFDVLRALAELRDAGAELHLICGNHDFWAGRFLEDELGLVVHPKEYRCELAGRDTLFIHGDGINPKDRAYRLYKKVARSRSAVGLFRLVHPDWAMKFAQGASRSSRALFSPEDPSDSAESRALRKFAKKTLAGGNAEIVICAHAHYPLHEIYPTPTGEGLYINTGDWLAHRTYLLWDGESFQRRVAGEPDIDSHRPPSERELTIHAPNPISRGKTSQGGG